eukprot:482643-Lingulodinium_polyedra.AAC.1
MALAMASTSTANRASQMPDISRTPPRANPLRQPRAKLPLLVGAGLEQRWGNRWGNRLPTPG